MQRQVMGAIEVTGIPLLVAPDVDDSNFVGPLSCELGVARAAQATGQGVLIGDRHTHRGIESDMGKGATRERQLGFVAPHEGELRPPRHGPSQVGGKGAVYTQVESSWY